MSKSTTDIVKKKIDLTRRYNEQKPFYGFLEKQSKSNNNEWKLRYFLLNNGVLRSTISTMTWNIFEVIIFFETRYYSRGPTGGFDLEGEGFKGQIILRGCKIRIYKVNRINIISPGPSGLSYLLRTPNGEDVSMDLPKAFMILLCFMFSAIIFALTGVKLVYSNKDWNRLAKYFRVAAKY